MDDAPPLSGLHVYPVKSCGGISLERELRTGVDRFRPNLVVGGCEPFAEDGWSAVRTGAITFRVAKPCARCVVTTVDQETGETGREPLRTLARFRREGNEVFSGRT